MPLIVHQIIRRDATLQKPVNPFFYTSAVVLADRRYATDSGRHQTFDRFEMVACTSDQRWLRHAAIDVADGTPSRRRNIWRIFLAHKCHMAVAFETGK